MMCITRVGQRIILLKADEVKIKIIEIYYADEKLFTRIATTALSSNPSLAYHSGFADKLQRPVQRKSVSRTRSGADTNGTTCTAAVVTRASGDQTDTVRTLLYRPWEFRRRDRTRRPTTDWNNLNYLDPR